VAHPLQFAAAMQRLVPLVLALVASCVADGSPSTGTPPVPHPNVDHLTIGATFVQTSGRREDPARAALVQYE